MSCSTPVYRLGPIEPIHRTVTFGNYEFYGGLPLWLDNNFVCMLLIQSTYCLDLSIWHNHAPVFKTFTINNINIGNLQLSENYL